MSAELEWIVGKLQTMSPDEILEWLGDEYNLEAKGPGGAPLKRDDSREHGVEIIQESMEVVKKAGALGYLATLPGQSTLAGMTVAVTGGMSELAKLGVRMPPTESFSYLSLAALVYLFATGAQTIVSEHQKNRSGKPD